MDGKVFTESYSRRRDVPTREEHLTGQYADSIVGSRDAISKGLSYVHEGSDQRIGMVWTGKDLGQVVLSYAKVVANAMYISKGTCIVWIGLGVCCKRGAGNQGGTSQSRDTEGRQARMDNRQQANLKRSWCALKDSSQGSCSTISGQRRGSTNRQMQSSRGWSIQRRGMRITMIIRHCVEKMRKE